VTPGAKPVIKPVKLPLPEPLDVLLSDVDGLWLLLQQIPLDVIAAPPSAVASPTADAEFEVMFVAEEIVTVGAVLMASFLQLNKKDKSSTASSTG